MIPFRQHHLFCIQKIAEESASPLDYLLSQYFRQHKAVGSKDRKWIADTAFAMLRWKGLIDYLCKGSHSLETRLETFEKMDFHALQKDKKIPLHVRVSFPKSLFERIVSAYGEEKAAQLCFDCNFPAPTFIRCNSALTSREDLLNKLQKDFDVLPSKHSKDGIIFLKKTNFFAMEEFKQGLFEIQDEGSQILAAHMKVKEKDQVLDYCSGSGGKTLAFAPLMRGQGQIYLHDIRESALIQAKKRLKRAKIQNAQVILSQNPKLQKLKRSMDWVLADVPCSGSGTYRRNPDMKWKWRQEDLLNLIGEQRSIFEKSLSYVKAGGHIVYGTCSIFPEENEEQVAHFLKTYDLELVGEAFQSIPKPGEMDGFFCVTFKRKL